MKHTNAWLRSSSATLLVVALLLSAACTDSAQQNQQQTKVENQAATITAIKAANTPGKPQQNQGVVNLVEMAGGYTYARVDIGGTDFWLATMMTELRPGEKIAWKDYAMMKNFSSKALNREFDQIMFVDRVFKETTVAAAPRQGIVAESMNAAGYSFIRVDENGSSLWLAAPETALEVGQSIRWSGGGQMRNFTSRSLNRVFDEIIFVDSVQTS